MDNQEIAADQGANQVTLTDEERAELSARNNLIDMYNRTVVLLDSERKLFLRHLLDSKGLDSSKQYVMDPTTGVLSEAD